MCMRAPSSFQDHFALLSNPRSFHAPNQRHELIDILVIAVCAVICGAEGWEDLEEYGQAQAEWFTEILALPNGIPGHDTFRRVLSRLDPDELTQCFVSWTAALSALSGGEIVATSLAVFVISGIGVFPLHASIHRGDACAWINSLAAR